MQSLHLKTEDNVNFFGCLKIKKTFLKLKVYASSISYITLIFLEKQTRFL